MSKIKIELSAENYEKLINLLEKRGGKTLKKIIEKSAEEYKKILENKKNSTGKATAKKIQLAKEKIKNAVEQLKKEGKEINNYSVSKTAGISYNTARKYKDFIQELAKN